MHTSWQGKTLFDRVHEQIQLHWLLESDEATPTAEVVLFWGPNVFDGARGGCADDITEPVIDPPLDTIQCRMRREDGDPLSRAEKERLLEGIRKGER